MPVAIPPSFSFLHLVQLLIFNNLLFMIFKWNQIFINLFLPETALEYSQPNIKKKYITRSQSHNVVKFLEAAQACRVDLITKGSGVV